MGSIGTVSGPEAPPHADPPNRGARPRRRIVAPWLVGYDLEQLRGDLVAGLTVGVLLVPQAMAYAQLAGAPAILGLYACVVPPLLYVLLGTSMHIAVGVVAVDMFIVHAGLASLADPGSPRWLELMVLLTLLTGLIQVVMAATRMGFLVNLLSRPVLVGFGTGAALLIAMSAVGALVGIDLQGASTVPLMVWGLARGAPGAGPWPLVLGAISIAVVQAMRMWSPRVPGALVVVVVGTVAVSLLDPEGRVISVVGTLPAGFPPPRLPTVDWGAIPPLLPTAATLARLRT